MILYRLRPEFSPDWTSASFEGEDEEELGGVLVSRLLFVGYEILISRDEGETYLPLGEDEG